MTSTKPNWASAADARFDVQIYDLSVKGLAANADTGTRSSYLKINFDNFKTFSTDVEENNLNPTWSFRKRFVYRTRFVDRFVKKYLQITCCSDTGNNTYVIGEAQVDLHTIFSGPEHFELTLMKDGSPAGALEFYCKVQMISKVTIVLSGVEAMLKNVDDLVEIEVVPSMSQDVKMVLPLSKNGWPDPYHLTFEVSLAELIPIDGTSYLLLKLFDSGKTLLGEAKVFTRRHIHLDGRTSEFTVTARNPEKVIIGEVSGSIAFNDVPLHAQMIGGITSDNGKVVGGKLLFPGLPFPLCFDTEPPAYERGKDADENQLAGEAAYVPAVPAADDSRNATPATSVMGMMPTVNVNMGWDYMPEIPLPPHWEMRVESTTGRPFFADDRVKSTCWEDPRFLSEGWDQRIDPNTGRVYYAHHRSRRTTFVDPRGLKAQWNMKLDSDGRPYFGYAPTQQTSYIDPRGLPKGYDAALDSSGHMYFLNHTGQTTTWEDPRQGQTPFKLSQWKSDERRKWWADQKKAAYAELEEERKKGLVN